MRDEWITVTRSRDRMRDEWITVTHSRDRMRDRVDNSDTLQRQI